MRKRGCLTLLVLELNHAVLICSAVTESEHQTHGFSDAGTRAHAHHVDKLREQGRELGGRRVGNAGEQGRGAMGVSSKPMRQGHLTAPKMKEERAGGDQRKTKDNTLKRKGAIAEAWGGKKQEERRGVEKGKGEGGRVRGGGKGDRERGGGRRQCLEGGEGRGQVGRAAIRE